MPFFCISSRVFFDGTIFFDGTTFWERIVQIDFPYFTLNRNAPTWQYYKHPGQFLIIIESITHMFHISNQGFELNSILKCIL